MSLLSVENAVAVVIQTCELLPAHEDRARCRRAEERKSQRSEGSASS